MAFPTEKGSDELDDRVRLGIGEDRARIFEEYSVQSSILQQPAAFSVRLSAGGGTAALLKRYPPRTPFTLDIGPCRQFTGELDGYTADGASGETSVTFHGRDLMARLFDSDIDAERSFENSSYVELMQSALNEVGLSGRLVSTDNAANIRIRSGVGVTLFSKPVDDALLKANLTGQAFQTSTGQKLVIKAKLGESWFDFLQRHIQKFGLFMWADANGGFILSRPAKDQAPTYRIVRQRGLTRNAVNVKRAQLVNNTVRRMAEVVIHTRSLGKKFGRKSFAGGYDDEEMRGWGYTKRRVFRDVNVTNETEAEAYAARAIGEANRAGWRLTYTISGHTLLTMKGSRAVVVPDTVVRVDDDELNIHEPLYVESCDYRSPPRETTITLMRPKDIVFGAFEEG
jgi:prophage tail gpP-like protein